MRIKKNATGTLGRENKRGERLLLVTGGATGIGLAVLRRFVEGGWNVLCHYHSNEETAREIQEEVLCLGMKCDLIQADLSTEEGIAGLVASVQDRAVDSLVNNAGAYVDQKHFTEISLADLSKSFLVNLAAPFLLSSALFPAMCERGFGRIVNISSIAAKYGGSAFSMHYGCFKRGLEGTTRTLAREGASQGVLVNTVRPGMIDTSFHEKYPKDLNARLELIPVKRMGTSNDVAELAFYLGSEVNAYITGQTVAVSGGE